MMRIVTHSVPYALTFVVLTGPDNVWNWLLGVLLGGVVALAVVERRDQAPLGHLARMLWLPWLVWGSARAVVQGAWQMLKVLAGLASWRNIGFVTVNDAAETETGLALLALVWSASPGSVVAEVDRDTRTLVINTIDATDPEQERAATARFYRRYQKRAVP